MRMNLKDHKIFIGGLQGSGKTTLAKKLIGKFKKAISIRITPDYDDVDNLVLVSPKKTYADDLEDIAQILCHEGEAYEEKKIPLPTYDLFVIDEADLAFRGNYDLGMNMLKLIAMHRHYGMAIMFITRRIQDIPPRIVETCKYKFFFAIEGKNVMTYIINLDERLFPLIQRVSADKHNFVFKEIGKPPILHEAVRLK